MLASSETRIKVMGQMGFSAKVIREYVRKKDKENWSLGAIYSALGRQGVSLRAVRNGETFLAQKQLRDLNKKIKKTPGHSQEWKRKLRRQMSKQLNKKVA